MSLMMSLYLALLFVAFVPGVLVTLPSGGKKMVVLAVHAVLFIVVWYFTNGMVSDLTEGFQKAPKASSLVAKATRPTLAPKATR